ncbi:MAG: hypothetical protein QM811_27025 [Pirellulales bacterium]
MTSPLRKSHRITARPTATSRKGLVRLLGLGLVAAAFGQAAVAGEELKWRAARPPMAARNGTPGQITPAQSHVRQVAAYEYEGPSFAPPQAISQTQSVTPVKPVSTTMRSQLQEPSPLSPLGNLPAPSLPAPTPTPEPSRLQFEPPPSAPAPSVPAPDFGLPAPAPTPGPGPFAPGNPNSRDNTLPPPSAPINENISNMPLPEPGTGARQRNLTQEDCEAGRAELAKSGLDLAKSTKILDLAHREKGALPFECTLETTDYTPRSWGCLTYTWKASALCHKPLYFEQAAAERYGHSYGPLVDPLLGAAHFFGTLPILPYKMGVDTPCECQYSLGYYRPGDCAPYMIEPFPISARGAAVQAGFVGAAIATVP